jgi:hypothetical protein
MTARVAPITGAWIETDEMNQQEAIAFVAPITGAWIETVHCAPSGGRQHRRAHHGRVD